MSEFITPTNITFLALIVVLFIALREFYCWYFKINAIHSIQKQQLEVLKKIEQKLNESNKEGH